MAGERWLEASEVIPMFPTLVWKFLIEAGLRSAIDAKILATLEGMRRELPKLAPGQGWQSEQALHGREEFGQLAACVGNAAKSVLRFLRIGCEACEITACWATVLAPGAAHKPHSHPNNFLSGVYYVRTSDGADTINFHPHHHLVGVLRRQLDDRRRTPTRWWCGCATARCCSFRPTSNTRSMRTRARTSG